MQRVRGKYNSTGMGFCNGTELSTVVGRSNGTGRSSTILQYSIQQGVVQFSSAVQGWVVTTFYPVEIETFRFFIGLNVHRATVLKKLEP